MGATRKPLWYLLLTIAGTQTALAQACPPPPTPRGGPPVLRLSETATIHILPNLLVADLVANAEAPSAVRTRRFGMSDRPGELLSSGSLPGCASQSRGIS